MRMTNRLWFPVALMLNLCVVTATASMTADGVPTQVMVRAIARDAKIIGTGVGGARITIRDAGSGKVLAEGLQEGATGSTDLIMKKPRSRGESVFNTEGAAGFLATITLSKPTVVEIIAEGPLGNPQSMQRVTKTMLLVPGQHILGDGVILEIHGFTVELLAPEGASIRRGDKIEVRARVTMT